jgi:hypothetical protein
MRQNTIMTTRTDRIVIDGLKRNDNDFLVVSAKPTRAGVFNYLNHDGSMRRELRHPDEVFKADSMATLQSTPLTDLHPANGRVTSRNSKALMVGIQSGDVKRTDDDYIETKITVTDEDAISKIEAKSQVELSCGYDVDVVDEAGEYNGEPYDCRQTNIRYNHIAIVPKGRAGSKARIYCDSIDAAASEDFELILDEEEPMTTKTLISKTVNKMTLGSLKLDAIELKLDEDAMLVIAPLLKRADELEAHASQLQSDNDGLTGQIDQLKADSEKLVSTDGLNALAIERADVLGVAAHVGLESFDELSNTDIKRKVIEKRNDGLKLDGKSAEYVAARFDAITEQFASEVKGFKSLALLHAAVKGAQPSHEDSQDEPVKSPRDTYLERVSDMHKDTLKH